MTVTQVKNHLDEIGISVSSRTVGLWAERLDLGMAIGVIGGARQYSGVNVEKFINGYIRKKALNIRK